MECYSHPTLFSRGTKIRFRLEVTRQTFVIDPFVSLVSLRQRKWKSARSFSPPTSVDLSQQDISGHVGARSSGSWVEYNRS